MSAKRVSNSRKTPSWRGKRILPVAALPETLGGLRLTPAPPRQREREAELAAQSDAGDGGVGYPPDSVREFGSAAATNSWSNSWWVSASDPLHDPNGQRRTPIAASGEAPPL